MSKIRDIINEIEKIAPPELAEGWDNIGLLVGDYEQEVTRVFLALDPTRETINEAIEFGAQMMITHHPITIMPIKRITRQDVFGRLVHRLARNNISLYTAHTNFDRCDGGLNAILAEKVGIVDPRRFTDEECIDELGNAVDNYGMTGNLAKPVTLAEFAAKIKEVLNVPTLKYAGDGDRIIKKAAVTSGGGGDLVYAARNAGADVFVTGDVKHHIAQYANEVNLAVIDAGHFETEVLMCEFMRGFLNEKFPSIEVGISKARSFFNII